MPDVEGLFFQIGAKFDGLQQAFGNIETMMRLQLGQAAIDVGRNLTESITRPLLSMGESALKLGSDFQQTKIAFTTMLGSAERATAFLTDLKAFAAGTPFEFPGLVDAARRLQALGFAADQVIPSLRSIGDAAAALGGGAQMIDRVTLALGQMQSKGKVSAQEINQLAESGISAWKILADGMGKTIPEVMKLAEKGMINAARAVPEILEALNKQFGGMMAKQAETLAGQWSNVKDKITFIMMDLGEALAPAAQRAMDALQPIIKIAEGLVAAFKDLAPETQMVIIAIAGLAAAAGPLLVTLGSLGIALTTVQTGLAALGLAGITATGALTGLGTAVAVAAGAFAGWQLGAWLEKNIEWFRRFGEVIAKWIDMIPGVKRITESFAGLPAANKSLADSVAMLEAKLRAKGIVLDKTGLSIEEYSKRLRNLAIGLAPIAAETDKGTVANVKNQASWLLVGEATKKAAAHHKEAAEAAAAHAKGVSLVGELAKRHAKELADEAGRMAKATDEAFRRLQDGMKPLGATFHELYANLKKIGTEGVGYLESLGIGIQEIDAGLTNVGTDGVRYLESLGIGLGKLDPPMKATAKETNEMGKAWTDFGKQVSTILTDFGKGIADSILHAKSFGEAFTKMANALKEAFLRTVVEGAINQAIKGLDGFANSFSGLMGKLTGGLSSLFGGAGAGAGGAGAGGAGGAGGGLGGAAGGAGGLLGALGAIGNIGSMVSGIIGNFQFAGMNKTLDLIEKEVRYSQIHLLNILNLGNQYWPWMENLAQLQRLESIERVLYEGGGAGMGDALQLAMNSMAEAQRATHTWLKAINDGVWATYGAVSKPGFPTVPRTGSPTVPTNGTPITTGGGGPNVIVNVTSNNSNPYTMGLQVGTAINSILPSRA